MNIENYRMDFDERLEYVRDAIVNKLENDDEAFTDAVVGLISWNGFIDVECFPMDEIDEICYGMKPSELISQMTSDFNSNDDYFYFSTWGLESTDDPVSIYRDETSSEDVADAIIDNYNNISLYDSALDELVSIFLNEDVGIEQDFDIDDEEAEEPEETDDEFKDRIDSI